jgi:branched-chain amino acid transport system permease protein
MDLTIFLQNMLNGFTLGALYSMIAVGITIIYGITRIINFAHGQFYMIGGYLIYLYLNYIGLHYYLALPLTVISLFLLGLIFDFAIIRSIQERGYVTTVVVTSSIGLIIGNLVKVYYGRIDLMINTFLTRSYKIGPIYALGQRLFSIPVVFITFWALHWMLFHTKTGKAMRAYSQNKELCDAVGIDRQRISTISIALSAALAGLGAGVIAPISRIFPNMGGLPINKAYVVICMGGFGNVKGALVSAFIVGFAESLFAGYFYPSYKDLIGFTVGIIIFLLRPQGIFGTKVGFEW